MSIIGKIVGCGIGAKISGMSNMESLQVGVGMIPRMELALIIVTAAISHGIFVGQVAHTILLTTILLTIVTSLITPILIKATFKNNK
jgi:Kef-type K+ transport system membrane component KefB